jgi:two-component system, chemotaxis family, protein-glutamate methylesterase/glutaminase
MERKNIIVIGASAGGFDVIKKLIALLPAELDAAIFIVWHMSPDVQGVLPRALNQFSKIPAAHAVDREPVKRGRIYVAPPDHHMLIDNGYIRVTRGPKENRFRPAIDPLFRSAAFNYNQNVIGIILSGALDDGTAGLWTIKRRGGLAIVQLPAEAEVSSMPENAIRAVAVDYILPVQDMPAIIIEHCSEQRKYDTRIHTEDNSKLELEINIAMENHGYKYNILDLGELTPYTCPECHGVLTSIKEGDRIRYRCHTGHAFSADTLLAGITEGIEDNLWTAIRNMQESIMLLNHMGDHFAEVNQPRIAALYFKKAKEAEARVKIVRQAVMDHEQLSTDGVLQQSEEDEENRGNEN